MDGMETSRVFTTAMLARSVQQRKQSRGACYQDLLDMSSCEESYSSDNDMSMDDEPWIDVSWRHNADVRIPETPCTPRKNKSHTTSEEESIHSWLSDKYLPTVIAHTNMVDDIISIHDMADDVDDIESCGSSSSANSHLINFVSSEDDDAMDVVGGAVGRLVKCAALSVGDAAIIDKDDVYTDALPVVFHPITSQWMDADYNPHIGTLPFDTCGERDLLSRFAFRGTIKKNNNHGRTSSGRSHSLPASVGTSPVASKRTMDKIRSASAPALKKRKRLEANDLVEPTRRGLKRLHNRTATRFRRRAYAVKPLYQSSDITEHHLVDSSELDFQEHVPVQTGARDDHGDGADDDDTETTELIAQVGWPDMHRAWTEFKQHWQIPTHLPQQQKQSDFVTAMDWRSRVTMSHFEIAWKVYCRYAQHALGEQKTEGEIGRINYYDHVVLGHAMQCFFLDTSLSTPQQQQSEQCRVGKGATATKGTTGPIQTHERPGELLAQKMRQYIFSLL